jgi:two-component system, response regulator PdtaR
MTDKTSGERPVVILVVEDEILLRELAADVLEDAGFVALEAGDAEDAVGLLETRSDIAVLFTDINMPGPMNGLELVDAVRKRWPSIKILVASGDVRPRLSDLPLDSIFLGKPYRGEAVIAGLRSLMTGGRASLGGRVSAFAQTDLRKSAQMPTRDCDGVLPSRCYATHFNRVEFKMDD